MKKSLLLAALMVAPSLTFAGGMGNMDWYDSLAKAKSVTPSMAASTVDYSTENPNNALGAFADCYQGAGDANGLIEFEECFGETKRAYFSAGQGQERENTRQSKAQSKAARLRFLYR